VCWEDVFFVSRRSGLLLLFGMETTVAARGGSRGLDRLDEWIGKALDQTALRRRLVRQLGHEVVLFTAGCAVEGEIDGRPVRGLYVVAATRRGLYLVSGREQWTVGWPVERVRRQLARPGEAGGDVLTLIRKGARIHLRYLFPEEVVALAAAARQTPSAQPAEATLELFARREVAPPPPAELPEFSLAAGSLHAVARRAAANVPGELHARALLPPDFFEEHFLELGELALGPLLARKSAATRAGSLGKAVTALDAAGLREDTAAAVSTAASRTVEVFDGELARVLSGKRAPVRLERELGLSRGERHTLEERMQAPFERLWSRFEGLEDQQIRLLRLLRELDDSPPEADDVVARETATEWRATLNRLDSGYEGAWRELVEEIEKTWSTDLLPRLARANGAERSGVPEWVRLALLAIVTVVVAAALVLLVVR
jgi:hypothetical protein